MQALLLNDLRGLEAAQGYATLGLFMHANRELESMSAMTRNWPEVLAVKLTIFDGLKLWDLMEVTAAQLRYCAQGNKQWISLAETASVQVRAARWRERLFAHPTAAGLSALD